LKHQHTERHTGMKRRTTVIVALSLALGAALALPAFAADSATTDIGTLDKEALAELPTGVWHGLIESGYSVHLLFVFALILIVRNRRVLLMTITAFTIAHSITLALATLGLLHGFGFASALTDVGLPQGDVPLALFAFNVGVELGQLAFIAVVLGTLVMARRIRLPSVVDRYALPVATYAIGTLAAFWFFERLARFVT